MEGPLMMLLQIVAALGQEVLLTRVIRILDQNLLLVHLPYI